MSTRGVICAALAVALSGPAVPRAQVGPEAVRVRFETALGAFEVELDAASAPITTADFLKYVDGGFYDGGRVHRSARLEMQGARRGYFRSSVTCIPLKATRASDRRYARAPASFFR